MLLYFLYNILQEKLIAVILLNQYCLIIRLNLIYEVIIISQTIIFITILLFLIIFFSILTNKKTL